MNSLSILDNLDWGKYQTLFAFTHENKDLYETIDMAQRECKDATLFLSTRCILSTKLAGFLLNREDEWREVDFQYVYQNQSLQGIEAINIEIDVTDRLDHMFMLFKMDGQWYILQSYVTKYEAFLDPVDIDEILSAIYRWTIYGVNPQEWEYFFHVPIPSTNIAVPTVYIAENIYPDQVESGIQEIENILDMIFSKRNSFVHNPVFSCILSNFLQ